MAYIQFGSTPGVVISAVAPMLSAASVIPAMANGFGSCVLVSLPMYGDNTPETKPDGKISSAAWVGESSPTAVSYTHLTLPTTR